MMERRKESQKMNDGKKNGRKTKQMMERTMMKRRTE